MSPGSLPSPMRDRIGQTIPTARITNPKPIKKRWISIAQSLSPVRRFATNQGLKRITVLGSARSAPGRSGPLLPETDRPRRVEYKSPESFQAALSAVEISVSVAFSASLTGTPPAPRNPPPSLAASATCWLICCSHLL